MFPEEWFEAMSSATLCGLIIDNVERERR